MGDDKSTKKNISENYSFKELEAMMEGTMDLKKIYRQLNKVGFNNEQLDKVLKNMESLKGDYDTMQNLPDKFNEYFADLGWIAYESLSYEVMKECVELARLGKVEDAEGVLINHFKDEETIRIKILSLNKIKEFKPRMSLLRKALNDHFEERYHASVPVILMLIDGFVNDIEQLGFFATEVDLEVWDSIAAHDSGLNKIAKIFSSSRKKTRPEDISLPYRNGILHGRDLGYDNVSVSSKALSTLLALGDWAQAIKVGKKGVQKEYCPPTLKESLETIESSLESLKENQRERKHMNSFKKREKTIGVDTPAKGKVEDYGEDTPERTVVEFLTYLLSNNFGKMANLVSRHFNKNKSIGKQAGELSGIFKSKKLIDYELISIYDSAPAISEIKVALTFEKVNGDSFEYEHNFRISYEDEDGKPVARGYRKADWNILLMNIQELEYIEYRFL